MTILDDSSSYETNIPVIKVIGLGGAGCNTINRMINLGIDHIDYVAANTDKQVLEKNLASKRILLGPTLTGGLGAGGNPEIGWKAGEESYKEISSALNDTDIVFLTAGMGGGTGTGAISVTARIAKSLGLVVVAIVTTPFSFEFGKRKQNADEGIAQLRPFTDTLITIPNDKLLEIAPIDLPLDMAFCLADEALKMGIQGISELLSKPGLLNIDYAHIMRLLEMGGGSYLAMGVGKGENKVSQALSKALEHPLLDKIDIEDAQGIVVNFRCDSSITFNEITNALNSLKNKVTNNCEIIPGIIFDDKFNDEVEIILIATGIGNSSISKPEVAYLKFYGEPKVESLQTKAKLHENKELEITGDFEYIDVPAFLRNRQIPLELIKDDYGKTDLRSDM